MKGMKKLFDTKNSKNYTTDNCEIEKSCCVDEKDKFSRLGDIDELIFPEDEPYYISER
ncbi:MAG: hypothetical protein IKA95_06760 [Clostridia bacterium]|nr:hypothetical protein [Clostridia bacterium]